MEKLIYQPRRLAAPLAGRGARRNAAAALLHALLLSLAFVALFPLLWMLCAAFKQPADLYAHTFLPWSRLEDLTLDNFRQLFASVPFGRWFMNSLFVSSVQTVCVVTTSSVGGFALAKYRFRGRRLLMAAMLGTMLLPGIVLLPSSFLVMYQLGWLGQFKAILIPGAASAFGMFLFMQAMRSVPDELLQAGRVDGCSELRLWWEIALPIVRPMTGAFTLLTFLAAWNGYLWPSIVLDQSRFTIPIGLATMLGLPEFDTRYGVVMAATLLGILPVVVLFFILQRDFVSGLASGAVKG